MYSHKTRRHLRLTQGLRVHSPGATQHGRFPPTPRPSWPFPLSVTHRLLYVAFWPRLVTGTLNQFHQQSQLQKQSKHTTVILSLLAEHLQSQCQISTSVQPPKLNHSTNSSDHSTLPALSSHSSPLVMTPGALAAPQTLTTLHSDGGPQGLELLRNLKGQLSSRREDQGKQALGSLQQRIQNGQSKGTCFPRSGFRQPNDITA